MSGEGETSRPQTSPTPTPRDSGEEFVEGAQKIAHAAVSSPLLTAGVVRLAIGFASLAGLGTGVGSWSASTSASRQYDELGRKFDKAFEELGETRKALGEEQKVLDVLSRSWLASSERAEAQRHEERIRKLEEQAQTSILERSQQRLELEALKKERGK